MSMEAFLTIASFAMSVGGLLATLVWKDRLKGVVIGVVFATLFATTGIELVRQWQHKALIENVEEEILTMLGGGPKTFDQVYQCVYYRSYSNVHEALSNAVNAKRIGHELIDLLVNGKSVHVRNYFLIK